MPDINGIPYVESTDLVSGWPTVSQSVAQEVSDQLASKLDLAGGKILQIVRATDSTQRDTTSTVFVDASISVTITPQKSDSAVLLVWAAQVQHATTADYANLQITDSSNNAISGAEQSVIGTTNGSAFQTFVVMLAWSTPATTSATTYKGRFKVDSSGTARLRNNTNTGQLFALEVSA